MALLALTVAAPVLISATPAEAQSAAIRDIRVAGNKRVEPETVRSYLKFNVGDAYDPGKVDQSIKALFATGLFSDVRIDREGAGVVVTVVENPVVNQVAFEGNREVDKATLSAEVQLKPRSVFTRAKAQADVQRILDIYRRQGRFAASVDPKIIELDSNRVNVVYEINEGGATKVQAINFIGNKAFSDSQLRDMPAPEAVGADYSNTKELGRLLYTDYVYPFETAAVILLVAIVAAIALTLRQRKSSKYQDPAKQVRVRRKDRVRIVSIPPVRDEAPAVKTDLDAGSASGEAR